MESSRTRFDYDRSFAKRIIGTDEAGRGPAAGGVYAAAVCFDEVTDGGLKNFIIVTIKNGDTVIYEDGLTQTLSGDNVVFNCDIKANETYVLDIKYLMPIEAGNDAMNTRASFNIEFTIELI